MHKLYQTQSPS